MNPLSRYTKLKVVGGYVALFLLSAVLFAVVYLRINELEESERRVRASNSKLFVTNNIIIGLYESEIRSSAFIQTGREEYLRQYAERIERLEADIDSLKAWSGGEAAQLRRINSIRALVEEKIDNLGELALVKRSFMPDELYRKAIADIASAKDSIMEQTDTRTTMVTTRDSSYIKTGRKRRRWFFFRPQQDSVLEITVSHYTVVDSVNTKHYAQNTDSILNILNTMWLEMQTQTLDMTRRTDEKEVALIRQSSLITEKLKQIVTEHKDDELARSLFIVAQRKAVVERNVRFIAGVVVAAVLLILFFSFLILRDLSRSQRYRRQLEEANRYTDQLLESRKQMMRSVTHDIKSPLGSIIGYIELLHNMPLDEQQRGFLRNMKGSSEHILHLVADLLDFSRLEENKTVVETVPFNPAALLGEVCDNFIPLAAAKKLRLHRSIDALLEVEAWGDVLHVRQIVTNLLSNAVKYTDTGSIHVEAALVRGEPPLQWLVRIRDTGPGMTPEEQTQVFNEFTRLPSGRRCEGSGLGLTITARLVRLLGGTIDLESVQGEGSCFTLTLPLALCPAGSGAEEDAALTGMAGKRILFVDDDPLQLEMAAGLLKRHGLRADTTTRPEEVLYLLKEGEGYELVFTDIQMPGMNGFELVGRIRASRTPDIARLPVVALSAGPDNDEANYLQAGFTAYLSKPFTARRLLEVVGRYTQTVAPAPEEPAPQETGGEEAYTLKNILLFADGDQAVAAQMLQHFAAETRKHVEQLKAHIEQDPEAIPDLVHKMLPMFRQLEAHRIATLLAALERYRNMIHLPGKEAVVKRLATELVAHVEEFLTLIEHPHYC